MRIRRSQVHCNAVRGNPNSPLREKLMFLGLPAPLFTIDMPTVPRAAFQRFFDNLSPTFGHMISLGQSNTIVSCPALTTHSELEPSAISPRPAFRRRRSASPWATKTRGFAGSPYRNGALHDRPGSARLCRRVSQRGADCAADPGNLSRRAPAVYRGEDELADAAGDTIRSDTSGLRRDAR